MRIIFIIAIIITFVVAIGVFYKDNSNQLISYFITCFIFSSVYYSKTLIHELGHVIALYCTKFILDCGKDKHKRKLDFKVCPFPEGGITLSSLYEDLYRGRNKYPRIIIFNAIAGILMEGIHLIIMLLCLWKYPYICFIMCFLIYPVICCFLIHPTACLLLDPLICFLLIYCIRKSLVIITGGIIIANAIFLLSLPLLLYHASKPGKKSKSDPDEGRPKSDFYILKQPEKFEYDSEKLLENFKGYTLKNILLSLVSVSSLIGYWAISIITLVVMKNTTLLTDIINAISCFF